jgi:hypothetical protein
VGISLYIENQIHERSYAGDEASQRLDRIVAAGVDSILVRGIYAHGDTMFNTVQLRRLSNELDGLCKTRPDLSKDLDSFNKIVHLVIENRGYLWISGD